MKLYTLIALSNVLFFWGLNFEAKNPIYFLISETQTVVLDVLTSEIYESKDVGSQLEGSYFFQQLVQPDPTKGAIKGNFPLYLPLSIFHTIQRCWKLNCRIAS